MTSTWPAPVRKTGPRVQPLCTSCNLLPVTMCSFSALHVCMSYCKPAVCAVRVQVVVNSMAGCQQSHIAAVTSHYESLCFVAITAATQSVRCAHATAQLAGKAFKMNLRVLFCAQGQRCACLGSHLNCSMLSWAGPPLTICCCLPATSTRPDMVAPAVPMGRCTSSSCCRWPWSVCPGLKPPRLA